MLNRRRLLIATVAGAGLLAAGVGPAARAWAADAYPNQPIRLLVPYAAGGGTDAIARVVAQGVSEMVRAAECWTRTPTWPGWGAQALEGLDWAISLAIVERNCTALQTTLDSLRELGPRMSAGGLTPVVMALARTGESESRRLKSQGLCR